MTSLVHAADAADLLALVPVLTGFHPSRSVVFVLFRGTRSLATLRADLPEEEIDRAAATLVGLLCRVDAADGVAVVVYPDGARRAPGGAPAHADLVSALRVRADACGLRVREALCVGDDGWLSYLHPDEGSLDDLARRRERHAGAVAIDADQHRGAEIEPAPAARREAVAGALRTEDPGPLLPLLERMLLASGRGPHPRDAARLLLLLAHPSTLEKALLHCLRRAAADAPASHPGVDPVPGADPGLGAVLGSGGPPAVRPRRLQDARALFRGLVALAPESLRPGALAATSWACWALGSSSQSAHHAARALDIDPDHALSRAMAALTDAGRLPDWVYRGAGDAP